MKAELERFAGELIWPDHPSYEEARSVYNQRIDVRPALVARCRGNMDVAKALGWARDRDLEVAIRSAGNNYCGFSTSDGGVVIDVSQMGGARVDPSTQTARIGGGTLTGDVLREASMFGLAPAIGVGGATGVGLLLGGGFGYLRNRAGWSADNILAADLVTSEGQLVRVSQDEHPDLLWALRGAGANFGIATSLDVQLHQMPSKIRTGTMVWSEERLEEGLRTIRDISAQASNDHVLTAWLKLGDNPGKGQDGPPQFIRNQPTLEVLYCHWGPDARAQADIDFLRDRGRPDYEVDGTTDFVELHYRWGAAPKRIEWDAVSVSELNDEAISLLADIARNMTLPGAFRCLELFDQRGALARQGPQASAQPRSVSSAWSIRPGASSATAEFDAVNDEWILAVMDSVLAISVGIPDACALNSTSWIPDEARVRTHYGDGVSRLVELKRIWDPDNIFRKNQNIDPGWTV